MPSSRVVVVTGASGGVGRAVVRRFAAGGPGGVAGARAGRSGRGVAGCHAVGADAMAFPVDVADPAAVEGAAGDGGGALGPIDVWVNDAFSSVFAPFMQIERGGVPAGDRGDLLGYVYGTRAALARMLPRDRGTVVQVGSALAYRGIPLQSAYCGAKHAIQGFHESLRCELLHQGSGSG